MSVYISSPRKIEAEQVPSGYRVSDPVFGDVVISSAQFETFFRRPYSDERAEKAVARILASAPISDELRTDLRKVFLSADPLAFVKYLRSVNVPETVARELLKEKVSTTR